MCGPCSQKAKLPAADAEALLQRVVDHALAKAQVLFTVNRLASIDSLAPRLQPSLKVVVSAAHTAADLEQAATALKAAAQSVLSG